MPTTDFTRSLTTHEQKFFNPCFAPRPAGEVPTSDILDAPKYAIEINADWLPHLIGALSVLDQDDAWLGTESQIAHARSQVNEFIASIVSV